MRSILISTVLIGAFVIFAQTTEYPHVQDNGGGYVETPSYRSYASIGQPVIGECGDASHINQAGYITSLNPYLAIEEKPNDGKIPDKITIGAPYPNPFNSVCQIDIDIPQTTIIKFGVFDIDGRNILQFDKNLHTGSHIIKFDAGKLPSGIYFYRISADKTINTGKLILIK
ncbi:T9SS type A sorting domain-containing protein [bacterium]|nr:T9SS type A sorting domain-containing protein [bacterium]